MNEMECINLQRRFGKQYRVKYEESYHAEYSEHAYRPDPWLMIIPCIGGHICPWGGSNLAVCTDNAGSLAKRLKELPFTEAVQDGSDGANVVFDVQHFDEVAKIMRPRRRRQVSEAERQRLMVVGAKSRFRPGVQARDTAPECVPAAQGGD